jgi:hypothetical protein
VGPIDQHRQAGPVAHGDLGSQIAREALVAGRHQHHRRQGTGRQGRRQHRLQVLGLGRQPQPRGRIEGQVKQHRLQLAEQAAMQQAAVQVAGQQHPLARIGQAQQGRLQQATGAVHPIPTALCP